MVLFWARSTFAKRWRKVVAVPHTLPPHWRPVLQISDHSFFTESFALGPYFPQGCQESCLVITKDPDLLQNTEHLIFYYAVLGTVLRAFHAVASKILTQPSESSYFYYLHFLGKETKAL